MACRLFGTKPLPESMSTYCQSKKLQWNLNQTMFFIQERHLKMLSSKCRKFCSGLSVFKRLPSFRSGQGGVNLFCFQNILNCLGFFYRKGTILATRRMFYWRWFHIYLFISSSIFLLSSYWQHIFSPRHIFSQRDDNRSLPLLLWHIVAYNKVEYCIEM